MTRHLLAITLAVALTALSAQAIRIDLGQTGSPSPPPDIDWEEVQRIQEQYERDLREAEERFPAPGILTLSEPISCEVYAHSLWLGPISAIALQDFLPETDGSELAIVGSSGALIFSTVSGTASSVPFSTPTASVDIIDVEGDGIWEYMNCGSWGCDASVLNSDGSLRWSYAGGGSGVDDMVAGDVDGDGALEFAVGFNGGGGVHLLESDGTPIWNRPDSNVWHVELLDTMGQGGPQVVHSNAAGEITVRSADDGRVISRANAPTYFSHFSWCPWPAADGEPRLIHAEDNAIWALDFSGEVEASHPDANIGSLGDTHATAVQLRPDGPPHIAVAVSFRRMSRAMLFVFDSDFTPVHTQALPTVCGAVSAIRMPGDETESLFVGGVGQVWRLHLNER